MIDVERVMERANELYIPIRGHSIQSEQVNALAQAIAEAMNAEIEAIYDHIDSLA